jgi:hypothetical protein
MNCFGNKTFDLIATWRENGSNMPIKVELGDIAKMKKAHPCGSDRWEIVRTGMDIGIKCLGCGRRVLVPRPKFEKALKTLETKKENS